MRYIKKICVWYPTQLDRTMHGLFEINNFVVEYRAFTLYFEVENENSFIGAYIERSQFDNPDSVFDGQSLDGLIHFKTKDGSPLKYLGYGTSSNPISGTGIIYEDGRVEIGTDIITLEQLKESMRAASEAQGSDIYANPLDYTGVCINVRGLESANRILINETLNSFVHCQLNDYENNYISLISSNVDGTTIIPIFNIKGQYTLEGDKIFTNIKDIKDYFCKWSNFIIKMGYYQTPPASWQEHIAQLNPVWIFDIDSGVEMSDFTPDDAQNYADTGENPKDKPTDDVVDDDGDNPSRVQDDWGENADFSDPNDLIFELDASNFYDIDVATFEDFMNFFWHEYWEEITPTDQFFGLYENLSQNVASMRCFFVRPNVDTTRAGIQLGQKNTSIMANRIQAQHPKTKIGELKWSTIKDGMHNASNNKDYWLNYLPYTKAKLYLPYYGLVDINMNKFIKAGMIRIYLQVEVLSGTATYHVYYVHGNAEQLDSMYEAQIAIDVPFALIDSADIAKKQMDAATNLSGTLITSAATANAAGAASGILSSLPKDLTDDTVMNGGNVTNAKLFAYNHCQLILETTNASYTKAYAKRVGYPCHKSHTLNQLKGFTKVKNAQLVDANNNSIFSTSHSPTEREKEQIIARLEKGVIL